MNLSYESLKQLEKDVLAGDARAIAFVKSMRGEVNAAREKHGMPIFSIGPNGDVVIGDETRHD
jgi:hypothetical protein